MISDIHFDSELIAAIVLININGRTFYALKRVLSNQTST